MNTKIKIVSLATLKRKIQQLKKQKKTIAFTNGCFDILHSGHISYLEAAKNNGRILVLGLNSDKSIRRIKGSKRPIVNEESRARVISALECVDFVTIFEEDTPYNLISAIKPDVLIKGADWKGKVVVGSDVVKANGGKVELIKYVVGRSTTNIIGAVLKKCQK